MSTKNEICGKIHVIHNSLEMHINCLQECNDFTYIFRILSNCKTVHVKPHPIRDHSDFSEDDLLILCPSFSPHMTRDTMYITLIG